MIQDQTTKVIYVGNGQTTHFPFKFKYNDKAHIHVAIYDIDTQVQTELTKDFFVDSEKNEVIYPGYQSGQEPPEAQIPPALQANQKLVIYRQTPLTQEIDFGSKYPLPFVENGTDKNTMISQEMKEALERSVKVDMGSEVQPDELLTNIKQNVANANQSAQNAQQSASEAQEYAQNANINAQSINIRTFPNVETMKQANNLKTGGLIKTQGFYQPNDGGGADYVIVGDIGEDEADEASIISLQKGLYAKLLLNNYINIKKLGAKEDGITDNTEIIKKSLALAKTTKKIIYFPAGIYSLKNIKIDDDIRIKGDVITAYGSTNINNKVGTILLDITDVESEEPFITVKNGEERITGFCLDNIRLQGNYHEHPALYLYKTGWEGRSNNLVISSFRSNAIKTFEGWDTFINNLTVYECGSLDPLNPVYAIELDGNIDVTNAWHITNMHLEGCRYMINYKRARHIDIVNAKFEMMSGTINNDSDNALIVKQKDSFEINMSDCFFVGNDIDTWREKNSNEEFKPPYYIENKDTDTEENLHSLRINNCVFTNITNGMLCIKSSNNTLINNCVFDLANGEYYAIDLNGIHDKLNNCKIVAISDKDAQCYPIHINNAICTNNSIKLQACTSLNPGIDIAYGSAICYEGSCIISNNIINNTMRKFWYFKNVQDGEFNNVSYVKRKGFIVLDDNSLKEMLNIDLSVLGDNPIIELDLDKIRDAKMIGFSLSKTIKIQVVKNGIVGEEIEIFNNSISVNVIVGGSVENGRLWNNNSETVTLGGNSIIKYICYGWQWREVGRCIG